MNWGLDLDRLVIDGQSEGHGVTTNDLSTEPGRPHIHMMRNHVVGDVAIMQKIMGKIFLNHIALVAIADDKIDNALVGIDFGDVPQ